MSLVIKSFKIHAIWSARKCFSEPTPTRPFLSLFSLHCTYHGKKSGHHLYRQDLNLNSVLGLQRWQRLLLLHHPLQSYPCKTCRCQILCVSIQRTSCTSTRCRRHSSAC